MDHLAQCLTNVLKIVSPGTIRILITADPTCKDHLSSIPYHIYSFSSTDEPGHDLGQGEPAMVDPAASPPYLDESSQRAQESVLHRVRHFCRDHGVFVATPVVRLQLWAFEGGGHNERVADIVSAALDAVPADLRAAAGQHLRRERQHSPLLSSTDRISIVLWPLPPHRARARE